MQQKKTDKKSKGTQKWFIIPFINPISYKLKHITKDLNTKISYYSFNKLGTIIKGHKDNVPNLSQMNMIYRLSCKNCSVTYVGQTYRTLKTRIFNTKITLTEILPHYYHSVITEYRLNFSHEFNWGNIEILDRERFLTKLISEMIYIKRQNNSLNLQLDTECLDGIIFILNKLQ